MAATFRCKLSGNTVTFHYDHDIEGMRSHPGYEEVIEEPEVVKEEPVVATKKTRGKSVTSVGN